MIRHRNNPRDSRRRSGPTVPSQRPTCRLLLALTLSAAAPAHAALVTSWVNPLGGDFGDPANWSLGAPGAADTALFNLDAGYAVMFDTSTAISRLLVRSGTVAFDAASMVEVTAPTASVPSVIVGELAGDDATLSIASGVLSASFVHVANIAGSVGAVEVHDGAALASSDIVYIGRLGAGSLDVTEASMAVRRLTVGALSTAVGAASLVDSALVVDETLVAGQFGAGTIEVASSTIASGDALIAQNYLSSAAVTLDGATIWSVGGSLDVGRGGVGVLEIRDGSQVQCSSFVSVATLHEPFFPPKYPASEGSVLVDGAGSALLMGGDLWLPLGGFASLNIRDGGRVIVGDDLIFNIPEQATLAVRFDAAGGMPAIDVNDDVQVGTDAAMSVTVALADGLAPVIGQVFDLIEADVIAATFAATLPDLPIGMTWQFGVADLVATRVLRARIVGAADINGDGVVDGADLGLLLGNWGNSGAGDLNGDGTVDGADLGLLLAAFNGIRP